MHARFAMPALLAATALLALAGCSDSDASGTSASSGTSTGTSAESSALAGDSVTVKDAWVKAADSGMSAAFGELTNTGTQDVTIVSASTTASSMIELHETVENESGTMIMRAKDGGFVIPAGGELSLAPGGNHIMLMDLTAPMKAGDEVVFTLTFSDDSTLELTAPAKDYAGANETYEGGDKDMGDMGEMDYSDMGDMDHSGHQG